LFFTKFRLFSDDFSQNSRIQLHHFPKNDVVGLIYEAIKTDFSSRNIGFSSKNLSVWTKRPTLTDIQQCHFVENGYIGLTFDLIGIEEIEFYRIFFS